MQCEAKIDGFIARLETAAPVALVGGVRALRQLPVRAGLQGEALGLRLVDELAEGDAAAGETVRKGDTVEGTVEFGEAVLAQRSAETVEDVGAVDPIDTGCFDDGMGRIV